MPHIQSNNLERSQFDALICKFERTSSDEYKDEFVTISIAFQRPPPLVSLFRSNPAIEMVSQLAKGLRDLLEDPPEAHEISVVRTSAWVKDKYVTGLLRLFRSMAVADDGFVMRTESVNTASFACAVSRRCSGGATIAARAVKSFAGIAVEPSVCRQSASRIMTRAPKCYRSISPASGCVRSASCPGIGLGVGVT